MKKGKSTINLNENNKPYGKRLIPKLDLHPKKIQGAKNK